MKPEIAAKLADALEAFAAVLRQEMDEQPQAQHRKLAVVAKEKGLSASTLRELIARKQITAVRFGNKRGVWLVDPDEVEAYFRRRTSTARQSLREIKAETSTT